MDLQLPMQSVPITTKVVSSNHDHGEVYSIQHICDKVCLWFVTCQWQGRIQDFKLGGGALKKIAPSGGRREHFWSISCEKSRFYTKKSNFFHVWREARKSLGYFVWKITILRQKIMFFSNFRGGPHAWCAPPPLDPPLNGFFHIIKFPPLIVIKLTAKI